VISQEGNFYIRYHVQDGGSGDGTVNALSRWQEMLNSGSYPIHCKGVYFSYTSEPDRGMYDAIAKGFSHMLIPPTAAMTWINADDILMPGALATVHKSFAQLPQLSWLIGRGCTFGSNGELRGQHVFAYPRKVLEKGLCDGKHWHFVQQEGTFWRKELWDKAGGLDCSFKYAGDWDLWRRFAKQAEPVHAPWPLGFFRNRPGQLNAESDYYEKEIAIKQSFSDRSSNMNKFSEEFSQLSYALLALQSKASETQYRIDQKHLTRIETPGVTLKFLSEHSRNLLCSDIKAPIIHFGQDSSANPENKEATLHYDNAGTNRTVNVSTSSIFVPANLPKQPHVILVNGFENIEINAANWSCWCGKEGVIHVTSMGTKTASIELIVASVYEEDVFTVELNGKQVTATSIGLENKKIGPLTISLKMGTNILHLCGRKSSIFKKYSEKARSFVVKNLSIPCGPRHLGFREHIALRLQIHLLQKSGLFFEEYYLDQSRELIREGLTPLEDYFLFGAWGDRDPNPLFGSSWYLSQNKDVYLSGENPLRHYFLHGWKEGRDPHAEFSTNQYLANYQDVKDCGINPLSHYLLHGVIEARSI